MRTDKYDERIRKLKEFNKLNIIIVCNSCGLEFIGNRKRKFCDVCVKKRKLDRIKKYKKKVGKWGNKEERKKNLYKNINELGITIRELNFYTKKLLMENPELLKVLQIQNKIKNYE